MRDLMYIDLKSNNAVLFNKSGEHSLNLGELSNSSKKTSLLKLDLFLKRHNIMDLSLSEHSESSTQCVGGFSCNEKSLKELTNDWNTTAFREFEKNALNFDPAGIDEDVNLYGNYVEPMLHQNLSYAINAKEGTIKYIHSRIYDDYRYTDPSLTENMDDGIVVVKTKCFNERQLLETATKVYAKLIDRDAKILSNITIKVGYDSLAGGKIFGFDDHWTKLRTNEKQLEKEINKSIEKTIIKSSKQDLTL